MNAREPSRDKQAYRRLRLLSPDQLWTEEVPRFNHGTPADRARCVTVVRAVGAAFAESGSALQKSAVRTWLRTLLEDPSEKVRRYAIAALPKLGAEPEDEAALLALLQSTSIDRERKFVIAAVLKIGHPASVRLLAPGSHAIPAETEQKIKASVARETDPGKLRMDRLLRECCELRIHLRCRQGLEPIVRAEVEERARTKFDVMEVHPGLVTVVPKTGF